VPRPRMCGSGGASSPARFASSRGHPLCRCSDPASRAAKTVLQRETGTRRWPLGVPDSGCPSVTVDSASMAPPHASSSPTAPSTRRCGASEETPPGAGPSTPLRSAARRAPPLALPDAASLRALRADDAEPEVVATHAEADSARTVRARGAVRRAALPAQAEVTGVAVPVDLAGLAAEADLVGGYALRTDVARAARDLEERGAAREEGAAVAFGRTAGLGEPWHHRAGRHRRVERRAVALLGGLDQPVPADRRRRAALVRDATPATRLPRWAHAARAAAAVIAAGLVRAVGRAATHI